MFVSIETDEANAFIGGGDFFFEEEAADDAGVIAVPLGQIVPDALLGFVICRKGEGLQDFEGHRAGFISGPEGGAETSESQAAVDDGLTDTEAYGKSPSNCGLSLRPRKVAMLSGFTV